VFEIEQCPHECLQENKSEHLLRSRSGGGGLARVSQPSLSSALEQYLGGALFLRKPFCKPSIALTVLGCAIRPYLEEIVRNADRACEAAQALASAHQAAASPERPSN